MDRAETIAPSHPCMPASTSVRSCSRSRNRSHRIGYVDHAENRRIVPERLASGGIRIRCEETIQIRAVSCVCLILVLAAVGGSAVEAAELVVERRAGEVSLRLSGQQPFRSTAADVADARLLRLQDGKTRIVTWTETDAEGETTPFYALGLRGEPMQKGRPTSYVLELNHGAFDPLSQTAPTVTPALAASEDSRLHLVQFVSQPLEAYRNALESLGATVRHVVHHHALVVEVDPDRLTEVAALDFVRWVGPYHPAYRIERALRASPQTLESVWPRQRYNLLLFDFDRATKELLARRIAAIGGHVDRVQAGRLLMEATLTPSQLTTVAGWDEIAYVDRWSPLQSDMDVVREGGGANYVESVAGYTGEGVRGEVYDVGFNLEHPDFASRPPLEHGGAVGLDSHGTACLGIIFGDGTGDPLARGLLPSAQPIAADAYKVDLTGEPRYAHTGELKQAPYFAVFQSSSVGSARTTEYTSVSAEHDATLFDWDVLHCQSQSNAGTRQSRPQAWAKNVVAGGAVRHYDTVDPTDDCWCGSASIGPASDGRVKPDLVFYYDSIYTTHTVFDDYGTFGGTSASTPAICGHFGLFFEMWADGIFGNDVDPAGTVFDNRPHMTTAKAFMINTARQYPFSGLDHDMARAHQGWGVPDAQALFDLRSEIGFVDESVVLANTEKAEFNAYVEAGAAALKATMTYADPAGNPAASIHRVNDLTLKMTSPSGAVYWGNHGLIEGTWSVPDGDPDTVDTVENVFVQNPEEGLWLVEVIASELIQDGHVETPELDADFALVVSGAHFDTCRDDGVVSLNRTAYTCEDEALVRVVDCGPNTDPETAQELTVSVTSGSEPGGETLELMETGSATSTFTGRLPLSATDAPGTLAVADGDTLTATYVDADDGEGGVDVEKTANAIVDCFEPQISGVNANDVLGRQATVSFTTDEEARGEVLYGLSCGLLEGSAKEPHFPTEHAILLDELMDGTTYHYVVEATDRAGNVARDDNDGSCYSFDTTDLPTSFTEIFTDGEENDTSFQRYSFTPDGSVDFYESCVETVSAFVTDPAGGTTLSLGDDDSALLSLEGGETVSIYGVSYGSLYVGSNGFVTFGGGDTSYSESLEEHFSLPRVSALFDDLNPSAQGSVSWKQTADRVAVTFEDVPELGASAGSTFQIELMFDGTIAITLLDVAASDGLIGLSEGAGVPPEFLETDLSAMMACGSGSGTVPGEAGASPPLLVSGYDVATGVMSLSYGVPCEASDHVIEFGKLDHAAMSAYQWSGQECDVGASGTYEWDTSTTAHQSLFFVIVANNGSAEGSYGRASDGSERPEDLTSMSCPYPQDLNDTCE